MYRCPHCKNKGIPVSALFAYRASGECKLCGTKVVMRVQPNTFILPAVLFVKAMLGMAYGWRLPFAFDLALLVALLALQFYLFEFRVNDSPAPG